MRVAILWEKKPVSPDYHERVPLLSLINEQIILKCMASVFVLAFGAQLISMVLALADMKRRRDRLLLEDGQSLTE